MGNACPRARRERRPVRARRVTRRAELLCALWLQREQQGREQPAREAAASSAHDSPASGTKGHGYIFLIVGLSEVVIII